MEQTWWPVLRPRRKESERDQNAGIHEVGLLLHLLLLADGL